MKELKEYERRLKKLLMEFEIHEDYQNEILKLVRDMLWGEIVAKEHFLNNSTAALVDLAKVASELPTENDIEQFAKSVDWAEGARWALNRIKIVR